MAGFAVQTQENDSEHLQQQKGDSLVNNKQLNEVTIKGRKNS